MKFSNEISQSLRFFRLTDEMIMVGKNGPGLEFPSVMPCKLKEESGEQRKRGSRLEKWGFLIGAGGNHVHAGFGNSVNRAVRPVVNPRRVNAGHDYGEREGWASAFTIQECSI